MGDIWRNTWRDAYGGTHTRRDTHTEGHIYEVDIHIKRHTQRDAHIEWIHTRTDTHTEEHTHG